MINSNHFSAVLVTDESIKLLKLPAVYKFDFNALSTDYSEIMNANTIIDDYIQTNFNLIEWDKPTTSLEVDSNSQKKTWIVTEENNPTGIIPFNRVQEIINLVNIKVNEVAYAINYFFKKG